ncbi:large conductance mechanosensitive channel [Marinilactibacillus piezotolerans]|uniref:Large-conductance mechanosensitive channel n=1 Tax=Marinilactibacillus piezotolerans TaxID=258723 RepID=A0A1I3Y8L6_9LACT|nr:large conductance mechanosensitive channel protein MscL [Marinilactibacillus piezotolerans]SFK28112.1 large conductance mechanosensitive channel [Marinilactibacillus piezotolerans]
MIKEFKEFIARGNVIELAVGLVMGQAFTAIVTALVDSIIMPLIVALTGQANVEKLTMEIGSASIKYGAFLQAIINFFLISIALFIVVKVINTLTKKNKPAPEDTPVKAPTVEEYLAEIRDLLAEKAEK